MRCRARLSSYAATALFGLLALASPLARAEEPSGAVQTPQDLFERASPPGGLHFFFGFTGGSVTLPHGSRWGYDRTSEPTHAAESGSSFGLALSMELERLLVIGSIEVGSAGGGLLGRNTLLAGYLFSDRSVSPYLAAGLSTFGKSFNAFDDPFTASSGVGPALEAGLLLGRGGNWGRLALTATAVLPTSSSGVWTPWISFGARLQL